MSSDTDFDAAFTILLGKAQGVIVPTGPPVPTPITGTGGTTVVETTRPATVVFEFSGGGTTLNTLTQSPAFAEIPFSSTIVYAHMYAGSNTGAPVAVSATIDVEVAPLGAFGSGIPLAGSGNNPALAAQSSATISTSGWLGIAVPLDQGDSLVARLTSFSGSATWVSLTLQIRPT